MQLQRIEFHLEGLSPRCLTTWCRVIENKIGVLQSICQNNGHVHMEVINIIYNEYDSAPFQLLRRFPWMAIPLHGMFTQYPNLTMVINAKTIQRDTIMGSLRQRAVDVPSIGGTTSRSRSHLEELLEAAFDSREWRCVARGMSRPLLHGDSAQR